jgi:uncharacterized zinc-type alcohol dehydrogenase-like protein
VPGRDPVAESAYRLARNASGPRVVSRYSIGMYQTRAYAAANATAALSPLSIERREPTSTDVQIEILYCGVCHSDLHQVRDEWKEVMPTQYPCVPGHEIVGRVTRVGSAVSKFRPGDLAAVGCMVDSCGHCPSCQAKEEQYCENELVLTYNGRDAHTGGYTFGGYSESVVVDECFVMKVPSNLDLAAAAPLLCAGITTYSPLRHWKVGPGQRVGVVGLGGLGHMAVKFAKAFGAEVVLFTTSVSKIEDGLRLGATKVVVTRETGWTNGLAGSFDFILDAVAANHDINAYLGLLKRDGTLTLVGAPEKPMPVASMALIFGRKSLSGSAIGGTAETQEMLDFCGEHGIVSDVEVIPIQKINEAYERMLRSDVKYRFVIDMASIKQSA